ncbi:S-layer homology domain-containing protein [Bacillus ectoiniformans]|uniref:S-layer homology domain-containing protein n=1 Tax=Bacillus ectoiniformans TaxID=1494429 RepID=UPI00195B4AF9|nr:S-layer homology domain-containing protein [Bacillus ectoiniformans]
MQKRAIIYVLSLLFVLIQIGQPTHAQAAFKDVDSKHWAKEEIEYLSGKGIIKGYPDGNFGLNNPITRLQTATMIVKALKLDTENLETRPSFKDVSENDYGYAIIAAVSNAGIMTGNDGVFNPNQTLSRAQMAAVLVRAFKLTGESSYSYRDVNEGIWASSVIRTLFQNHITTGYADNTFRPNNPTTRAQFAGFLARVLEPSFKILPAACFAPNNTKKHVIQVSAATLWVAPNKTRAIDAPSMTNPADLWKWTKSMTLSQKLDLVGKLETQALYGQEVEVIKTQGNWHQIAVKDQFTPKSSKGYLGWIPKNQVAEYYDNYANCQTAIVKSNTAFLHNSKSLDDRGLEISFDTRLSVLKVEKDWIQVQTVHNTAKWMLAKDVKIVNNTKSIPKPTQQQLVSTGKQFTGLPYLWAGVSGFGFDCSGFTYSVYRHHGINIPRDSSVQATHGIAVSKSNMQPGDLMFFDYRKSGKIHHVGMYIGNGQMIHAPNSSRTVEIIPITTKPYSTGFVNARRYLK